MLLKISKGKQFNDSSVVSVSSEPLIKEQVSPVNGVSQRVRRE